jgi:gluconate 2-dehydrogenase gamma chain
MVNVTPPPARSAQRYFSSAQLNQLKPIFEGVWPGGPDNPGATDAGAADYVDFLLGGSDAVYYQIPAWRADYTAGLEMLNAASITRFGAAKSLEALSTAEMTALLTDLAAGRLTEFPDAAWQRSFFSTIRAHCIEGCFADARWGGNKESVIWKWMGYPSGQARDWPFK